MLWVNDLVLKHTENDVLEHLQTTLKTQYRRRASLNGGVQLPEAGSDLRIHLALPRWLLREGVAIGAKGLADLLHMAIS